MKAVRPISLFCRRFDGQPAHLPRFLAGSYFYGPWYLTCKSVPPAPSDDRPSPRFEKLTAQPILFSWPKPSSLKSWPVQVSPFPQQYVSWRSPLAARAASRSAGTGPRRGGLERMRQRVRGACLPGSGLAIARARARARFALQLVGGKGTFTRFTVPLAPPTNLGAAGVVVVACAVAGAAHWLNVRRS